MEFCHFDFMPHGHCYFWRPEIVWSHAISDAVIAISYFLIPYGLIKLIRKRPDLRYKNLFLLFGLFIVACGTTHILSIINIWVPLYRTDAIVKIITALASLPTAIILLKILPEAVRIPSIAMWEQTNKELQAQIIELKEKDKTIEKVKEFEFLANSIPQLIWTSNVNDGRSYFNRHWTAYTSKDLNEIQDWDWDIIHPDDTLHCLAAWKEATTHGTNFEVEYRFKQLSDGVYRWHLGRAVPMKDKEGKVLKWFGTATDIHDLKMAQKMADDANTKFKILVTNAPIVIWAVDNDGICTILEGKGLDVTKRRPGEAVGMHYKEVLAGHSEIWATNIERALKGEELSSITERDQIVFETSFSPLRDSNGTIIGMVGISLDITKRKKAESESQFKSRFLASMSHEIRTPLNAVMGFANILKKSPLTIEQQEYVSLINKSGELLLKLIGDVLDLSKIEEGKLTIEKQPFNLKEPITSALYPYKFTAQESGISFELIFGDDLPENVIGDINRINQVLINLIGNAIKFSKKGKIEVRIEKVGEKEDAVSLKFSVADSGIGIPKEKQKEIFKSFTQGDANIHSEYGGSGLGLSIVEQLVFLMGSEIQVDSPHLLFSEPMGSLFWFILELQVDKTLIVPKKMSAEVKNFENQVKVLLVEDNEVNQILADLVLRNIGCLVNFANNGKECLEMLEKSTYSCILMDIQMPVMDGIEATKIIRKELKSTIPIIGLSANVYKEDIDKSLDAGMNSHIGKPYTEEQIYYAILKWLPDMQKVKESQKEKLTNVKFIQSLTNDRDEVRAMLSKALSQVDEFMEKMTKSVEIADWNDLAFHSHAYKSSARIIGATIFQTKLGELEEMAKKGNKETILPLFQEIRAMGTTIKEELQESLKEV